MYLLIPIYVVIYMRSNKLGIALHFVIIALSAAFFMILASEFMFRASPVNAEGYYLFSYMINKPWCKMMMHSMGVLTCFVYLNLLKYRKASLEDKKTSFPVIHFL